LARLSWKIPTTTLPATMLTVSTASPTRPMIARTSEMPKSVTLTGLIVLSKTILP
jgi:hypothetical protein